MTTISFKDFAKGGNVSVVGNEGKIIKNEQENGNSFMEGLSRVATTYGNNLKEQALGGVQNAQKTIGMGVDTMQQAQQIPLDSGANKDKAIMTGAAGAAQIGVGAMSGTIQTVFSPLTALVQTGIQGLSELDQATGGNMKNQIAQVAQSNPELIKSISDYVVQNPKKVQFASDMLNILTAGLGGKAVGEAGKDLTKGVTTGIKDTLGGTPKSIDGIPVTTMADEALHSGMQLKNDIQLSIAKKNVSPQLESSAGRLMSDTAQNVENPVVAYDKYLAQSKQSLGDIKVDAPISTVGGKIGDAFMKVVKQKQAVGATLGDELKSVGKIKVSVVEPKGTLLSELKDSGLSYNPRTNELTSFQGSKFAPEEVSMLNQYVKDVQALGDTPSVSQIDNFIAKTRSDLSFAKGKSGVTGTTNAERIIKGNLAGMRESLNPSKNGLTQLSKYWNANKAYSELSDFVEEGAGFLGKTTQSGDFAKDASVAKSSVQSILNGGKKDWLIKLEGLTGYPALDESVLALQAMKDAGDFKGLSLLQAMQESGGIPTTKAGFTQKILDMAIAKGEKLIVGTPEEQTRALLQDLSVKNSTKASTPTINSSVKPTGGTKMQSSKITSPSDIPAQSTPTTPKSKGIRGMYNIDELIKAFTPADKAEFKSLQETLSKAERMGITGYDKLGGATEKNFVGEYPAKVRSAAINLIHLVEDYPNKTEVFNSMDDNIMNVIKDSGYDINYLKKGVSSKIQPDTKGYILLDGKPQEVPAKKVDLGGGVDFFAHESKNGTVTITEKNSGMSIGSGQSLQEAIDNSKYVIKEKAGGISKLKELLKTKENKEIINSYSNNPSELVPKKKVVSSLEQEAKKSLTPSKVYHGTPSDFKGEPNFPLYLTSDKNYADIYQNPSASSLSSGKKAGVPTTKEFTVNPNAKVLDSRTPEGKKLLKEYWDNYSVSGMQVKTESGLPDWTEGTNLEEFLQEKGYKFDAILLDEGGVPSNNGTKSRGVSFVALNRNAFK